MAKQWKSGRSTVELQPSRIRREPPASTAKADSALRSYPSERDARTVIVGVILFAIALAIIVVGISDFTS